MRTREPLPSLISAPRFSSNAWTDYLYWQKTDRKILRKINTLINEISGTPYEGTGKPEALKFDLTGFWSWPK